MTYAVAVLSISGAVAARSISSETKISPNPIRMRPDWRISLRELRKNKITPHSKKSGIKNSWRISKIWDTIAEPMSAPSNIAVPANNPTPPFVAKFDNKTATAVALCKHNAAITPLIRACSLFALDRRRKARSCTKNARSTPVRNRRTAQIKSAAAPAICSANKMMLESTINQSCVWIEQVWTRVIPHRNIMTGDDATYFVQHKATRFFG